MDTISGLKLGSYMNKIAKSGHLLKKKRRNACRQSVGEELDVVEGDKVTKTNSEENKHRRTIILQRTEGASWGFTLQSYGIHHQVEDEVELLTYVDYVGHNSPAFYAGMRAGDVVLSIDGTDMEDADHTTLVEFIKRCGLQMRMVVLFEDCCRKVELHLRYMKLKRVLAEKVIEMRSLEHQEMRVLSGMSRFDSCRTSRASSKSSNSFWDDRLSLMPELDRCPTPLNASSPRTSFISPRNSICRYSCANDSPFNSSLSLNSSRRASVSSLGLPIQSNASSFNYLRRKSHGYLSSSPHSPGQSQLHLPLTTYDINPSSQASRLHCQQSLAASETNNSAFNLSFRNSTESLVCQPSISERLSPRFNFDAATIFEHSIVDLDHSFDENYQIRPRNNNPKSLNPDTQRFQSLGTLVHKSGRHFSAPDNLNKQASTSKLDQVEMEIFTSKSRDINKHKEVKTRLQIEGVELGESTTESPVHTLTKHKKQDPLIGDSHDNKNSLPCKEYQNYDKSSMIQSVVNKMTDLSLFNTCNASDIQQNISRCSESDGELSYTLDCVSSESEEDTGSFSDLSQSDLPGIEMEFVSNQNEDTRL